MGGQLADVDEIILDVQTAGTVQVVPLFQIIAIAVEDLAAVVLPVRHENTTLAVGTDAVDQVELSGIRAVVTPGEEVLAVRRVLVNAGVAVAVRDVEITAIG